MSEIPGFAHGLGHGLGHRLGARLGGVSIVLAVSVALTAIVTVLLLVFAMLFYQSEREQRWQQFYSGLSLAADQLAVAVELPLWNLDERQMHAILRSVLGNHEMVASTFTSAGGKESLILQRHSDGGVAELDAPPDDASLLVERRMVMMASQVIGGVAVYASPALLHAQLRERALAIGAMIVALDIILVASIWLLMWRLVLKPLKAIGQYAAAVKAGHSVAAGALPATWFMRELRILYRAIRAMVVLLDSRYRALQRSEERVQLATGAASIGIWDWNVLAGHLQWDEQMYAQFKADAGQGAQPPAIWRAAMLPEDVPGTKEAIRAALRSGQAFAHAYRIVWPDGAIRYIKVDAVIFRDGEGRPMRMVGSNYDITAHRVAELELLRHRHHLEELVAERTQELSVAVSQAQAADRAKSVFLANMSHELRTPLNAVIGFSQMMAASPHMQSDEKHNLAIIHRSGNHLLALINEILALSKGEAHCLPVLDPGPAAAVPTPAARAPLHAPDLAVLAPDMRAALLAALRELNLARVTLLLNGLPAAAQPLVAPLQTMLEQHQYRQLCALLDADDGAMLSMDNIGLRENGPVEPPGDGVKLQ